VINIDIDHFRARLLQDCLTEVTAQHWLHRAHQFQQAAPREGDFHGAATSYELLDAYQRCMATKQACSRHAELILDDIQDDISPEVLAVLAEVA
jgi:hypothetical protein